MAALAGALPGAADATTVVDLSGPRLRVAAGAGHANDITVVRPVVGVFEVSDGGDRVVAGAGCAAVDADTVHCPTAAVTSLGIDAGDLDDRVRAAVSIAEVFVSGGGGVDWLSAGGDSTVLSGGAGRENLLDGGPGGDVLDGVDMTCADYLRGGPGRDSLNALGDDDYLDGGPGGDALAGGADRDRVTYASRRAPVSVTLDGNADDGEANERDNVATDIEDILGGEGNDTLIGGPGPNLLDGGGGDDRLNGLDGADLLRGNRGADQLRGGPGDDVLEAFDNVAGNDLLDGEGDTDACHSDPADLELACET